MGRKKLEIVEGITKDIPTLTGNRKILFENMRKLYPKGKIEAQIDLCNEIHDSRVDYYINTVFVIKK